MSEFDGPSDDAATTAMLGFPASRPCYTAPMKRSLKHLLLWLLIAVLPLQGFAAVMLHGWSTSTAAVGSAPMAGQGMQHALPIALPLSMAMDSHPACHDAAAPGSDASQRVAGHGDKHGSCSTSAACCIGAAVPAGFSSFKTLPDSPDSHLATLLTAPAGHIPDGLERPPRYHAI